MKKKHLSEEEIQAIVFDKKMINTTIRHAQQCENCRNRLKAYELIFSQIKHEPIPIFSFEVVNPMLAQSKRSKTVLSDIFLVIFAVVTFALLIFGLTLYLSTFSNGFLIFNWLILVTASIVFIGLLTDTFNKHQQKLRMLNG